MFSYQDENTLYSIVAIKRAHVKFDFLSHMHKESFKERQIKHFFLKDQNGIYYYQHTINPAQDVPEKIARKYSISS